MIVFGLGGGIQTGCGIMDMAMEMYGVTDTTIIGLDHILTSVDFITHLILFGGTTIPFTMDMGMHTDMGITHGGDLTTRGIIMDLMVEI